MVNGSALRASPPTLAARACHESNRSTFGAQRRAQSRDAANLRDATRDNATGERVSDFSEMASRRGSPPLANFGGT